MLLASSWVLIRWGGDENLGPLSFAGLRYLLAAAVLTTVILRSPARRTLMARTTNVRRQLVILGLLQYAITQGAQFVAIEHQPLATTSMFLSVTPLLTAFGAGLIGERVTGRHLVAGVLVVGGAAIYFAGELGATATGVIAASVCLLANAAAALYGRFVLGSAASSGSALVITWVSMSSGALALAVTALVVEGVPDVSLRAAGLIGWLAVVNTSAAFTWWNLCLRSLPAVEMATIGGAMMPQIAVFGWVFFDEVLGGRELVGDRRRARRDPAVHDGRRRRSPLDGAPGRRGPGHGYRSTMMGR